MAPSNPNRPWSRTAIGGLLIALGGAWLGFKRTKTRVASPAPAAKAGPSKRPQGGKGQPRKAPTSRPQNWPPGSTKAGQPPRPRNARPAAPPKAPAGRAAAGAKTEALGYETRDTKAGAVGVVMLVSALTIAGSIAGLFVMIGHFRARNAALPALTSEQRAIVIPPGPPLQDHPFVDIAAQRKREDVLLHSYGWVDAGHSRARIPIERAVALVIGKPLDPPSGSAP